LGWPAGAAERDRVRDHIARAPKGAHGEHRYALADFGLDAEEQRTRFDGYRERFGVPAEV
jgi:hypothetical protein